MSETTQGDRHNAGKPMITLVLEAPEAIKGCAKVLEFGMSKYSRGNWKRGLKYTEIADSLSRHLLDFLNGIDNDEAESNLPHVDQILCNALFLSQMFHTRKDMDDRQAVKNQVLTPHDADYPRRS